MAEFYVTRFPLAVGPEAGWRLCRRTTAAVDGLVVVNSGSGWESGARATRSSLVTAARRGHSAPRSSPSSSSLPPPHPPALKVHFTGPRVEVLLRVFGASSTDPYAPDSLESRCGPAVRRRAGKQKDLGSTRFGSPFSSKTVVYGRCLLTLPTQLMKH